MSVQKEKHWQPASYGTLFSCGIDGSTVSVAVRTREEGGTVNRVTKDGVRFHKAGVSLYGLAEQKQRSVAGGNGWRGRGLEV